MENYDHSELGEFINIGVGEDITISELAELIKEIVEFKGNIRYDTSKPEGTPRKLMDVTALNKLEWKAVTSLKDGVKDIYDIYLKSQKIQ